MASPSDPPALRRRALNRLTGAACRAAVDGGGNTTITPSLAPDPGAMAGRQIVATIRVPGLVRDMNEVRQMLSDGIHPSQVPMFRAKVRRAVHEVEQTCRRHRVTPHSLPGPSRQAYKYLSSLDLNNLPIAQDDQARMYEPVRISNLITVRNYIREELQAIALDSFENRLQMVEPELLLSDIHGYILDNVAEVAIICYQAGATPASLPEPSKRAYQWLSYLAERVRLIEHYRTLERALGIAPWVSIGLYNIASLYHAWREGGELGLTMSEGFAGAPQAVIEALVKLALPYTRRSKYEALVREYAAEESFETRLVDLEVAGGTYEERSRGLCFDLDEVFQRVNYLYFGDQIARPRLTWNKLITSQEFGHYEPLSDTLMISITLDSPSVPQYVVEHVMHHELLHKIMGSMVVNGRRIFHSSEFKRAERQFRQFPEAEAFLKRMVEMGG
jgi:hypothetical protein